MINKAVNRRLFLVGSFSAVGVSMATRVMQGCGGVPATSMMPGVRETGLTVADVAVGQCTVPAGADYILARDAGGFYAFSNRCTHQGTALSCPNADGVIVCPDHQARYDQNGNNTVGPNGQGSTPSLDHYRVTFSGQGESARIAVDTSAIETDRTVRSQPAADSPDAALPHDATA